MSKPMSIVASLIILFSSLSAQEARFHQDVVWSPDGKKLAYSEITSKTVDGKQSFGSDIWVVNADGKERKKVAGSELSEYFVSWTPDGKMIAYGAADPNGKLSDIYLADIDGSGSRKLTDTVGRNSQPSVSPDGKTIVFSSTRESEKFQIYTIDLDGKGLKRLTKDDSIAHYNPQWSPDGRLIVFYSEKGDTKDQIWTMNPDGSNPLLLTNGVGHNIFPGFTPDGRIIFTSNRNGEEEGVYTMRADGSGLERIPWLKTSWARISPDGRKIAWVEGDFPRSDIFVANIDGSDRSKITE